MTTEAITPLRQRMIEDMNARKLGAHSQRSHIYSCKRFAAFLKRSPETATCEDIRGFQLHLAETGTSICNRNRIMTGCKRRSKNPSLEAAEWFGCAGVKIRHPGSLCLIRARARDEGRGALCKGTICGSD